MINRKRKTICDFVTDDIFNRDEKHFIISHARGVDQIVKWLEDWALADKGLKCIECSQIISYNYQEV